LEEEKLRNLLKYASIRRTANDLWEYKIVNTQGRRLRRMISYLPDWKDELERLGQEGWELTALSRKGELILKRRIPNHQVQDSDDYFYP
jgi:hypothetical protein